MKRQVITVPFVRGLDAGELDPHLTDGMLRAENAIITRRGAISKRFGKTALLGTHTVHAAMASHDGHPVLIGDTVKVLGDVSTFDTVGASTGRCVMSAKSLLSDASLYAHNPDAGILGDLVYIGRTKCEDTNDDGTLDTYSSLFDAVSRTSGAPLAERYSVSSARTNTRVLSSSSWERLYALYVNTSNQLCAFAVSADGSRGSERNLGSSDSWPDVDPDVRIDACVVSSTTIMVVYKQDSADTLVIGVITVSGDSINGTVGYRTETSQTNLKAVACCRWATSQAMVVYYRQDATRILVSAVYGDSGSPLTKYEADANIDSFTTDYIAQMAVVAATAGTNAICYWTRSATSVGVQDQLRRALYTQSTNTWGSDAIVGGNCSIVGKPVYNSTIGAAYLVVHHTLAVRSGTPTTLLDAAQRSLFVIRDSGTAWPTPIAHWWPDEGDEQSATATHNGAPTAVLEDGTDVYSFVGRRIGSDKNGDGVPDRAALALVSFDVTPAAKPRCVSVPAGLVIPGACPIILTGGDVLEMGPLCYPELVTSSVNAGSAGSGAWAAAGLADGTYGYRCAYELYDAAGNRYISAMSPVDQATVDASDDDSVTLTIPSLKFTRDGNAGRIRLVVYRSGANDTTYKRIGSVDNDPDAAVLTFVDNALLTDHSEAEIEYTNNDTEHHHWPPPPFEVACVWQQRLFFADPAYPDELIRYTQEFNKEVGVHFDVDLYVPLSPKGGDIVALEPSGDRLIIFKERAVFATSGIGKSVAGDGEGYAQPALIAGGIGCVSQASVVSSPVGVFFEAPSGIHLLSPDLSLEHVGLQVKYHTDSRTIARAVCNPDLSEVVFFTDGVALVYNYLHKQWTTWTNHAATDGTEADGVLYHRDSSGYVWKLDTSTRKDNISTAVAMAVETPWLAPGGPGQWCRIWRVQVHGYSGEARTLTFKVAYDYDPEWVDEVTLDTSALGQTDVSDEYGFPVSGDYQDKALVLSVPKSRTKCMAIRVRIEDAAAVDGELSLVSLSLEFAPLGRHAPSGSAREAS